jgi:hypothetical protein
VCAGLRAVNKKKKKKKKKKDNSFPLRVKNQKEMYKGRAC